MRPGPLALEIPAGSPAPQSSSWESFMRCRPLLRRVLQKGGGTLMFCLRSLKKKMLFIYRDRKTDNRDTYIHKYICKAIYMKVYDVL